MAVVGKITPKKAVEVEEMGLGTTAKLVAREERGGQVKKGEEGGAVEEEAATEPVRRGSALKLYRPREVTPGQKRGGAQGARH